MLIETLKLRKQAFGYIKKPITNNMHNFTSLILCRKHFFGILEVAADVTLCILRYVLFGIQQPFMIACFILYELITFMQQTPYWYTMREIISTVSILCRNSSDSEPSAKKRKTATAVVKQPGQESKILIDSVPDNTMNMDEVYELDI